MKVIRDFPCRIEVMKHVWIPMTDGCRLSARIWLPEDSQQNPVPAILEYIPYRKNDGTALRDSLIHPYFAGHGYAVVRVDLRGSGDSEGILEGEYLQQELEDGIEVLEWISKQSWCDGNLGMMGKSWGGFNSLQMAALQPKPLKAIITVCSTYADMHGGSCAVDRVRISMLFARDFLVKSFSASPRSGSSELGVG